MNFAGSKADADSVVASINNGGDAIAVLADVNKPEGVKPLFYQSI